MVEGSEAHLAYGAAARRDGGRSGRADRFARASGHSTAREGSDRGSSGAAAKDVCVLLRVRRPAARKGRLGAGQSGAIDGGASGPARRAGVRGSKLGSKVPNLRLLPFAPRCHTVPPSYGRTVPLSHRRTVPPAFVSLRVTTAGKPSHRPTGLLDGEFQAFGVAVELGGVHALDGGDTGLVDAAVLHARGVLEDVGALR